MNVAYVREEKLFSEASGTNPSGTNVVFGGGVGVGLLVGLNGGNFLQKIGNMLSFIFDLFVTALFSCSFCFSPHPTIAVFISCQNENGR